MNHYKALMAGFAAVVGGGGLAAYIGVFANPPALIQSPSSNSLAAAAVGTTQLSPAAPVDPQVAKADLSAEKVAKAATEITTPAATSTDGAIAADTQALKTSPDNVAVAAPTFDVLRVEPNGSVLIAGKAVKDSQVEMLSGADVLGTAKAQANGDFVIVLEKPLMPGDYQLVLRQTMPDGTAATSLETATVSVPDSVDGPVLALVEQAGKPSRIITVPQIAKTTVQETLEAEEKAAEGTQAKTNQTEVAMTTQVTAPQDTPPAIAEGSVNIEAVETEEGKVFVAGSATGVASVRVYANDTILGESKALPGNRFLIEVQKELTAGDYLIKAEGLSADGVTVLGRSTVPFKATGAEQVAAASSGASSEADGSNKKLALIIRRGDTLWQISRRMYGRGIRYSTIYLANKDAISDPNRIFPGQLMAIPDSTPEGDIVNAEEIKLRESAE